MYHYYKSVFTEDFEGGYPIEYDEELLKVEQEVLKKVRGGIEKIRKSYLGSENYLSEDGKIAQRVFEDIISILSSVKGLIINPKE